MNTYNPNVEDLSYETKLQNLKILPVKQVLEDIYKYPNETHRSYYVLPNGDLIDCRRVVALNHEKMAYFVYEELDRLLEEPGLEELKLKDSILLRPGNEQYFKCANAVKHALVTQIVRQKPALYQRASGVAMMLGDESLLLHDLNLTRVVIEKHGLQTYFAVQVTSLGINGKAPTGAQCDSVVQIAEMFGKDGKEVWRNAVNDARKLEEDISKMADHTM